jgi:hypothetical protein
MGSRTGPISQEEQAKEREEPVLEGGEGLGKIFVSLK